MGKPVKIPRPASVCGQCYLARGIRESECLVECTPAIEEHSWNKSTLRCMQQTGKCQHFATQQEWEEAKQLAGSFAPTLRAMMESAA